MTQIKNGIWLREVNKALSTKVEWTPVHHGVTGYAGVLGIECSKCGRNIGVELTTRWPSEIIRKKISQLGWDFSRKATCPECLVNHETNDNHETSKDIVTMNKANPGKPVPPPNPSDATRAAKRQAIQWLEECFEMVDEASGRYKDRFSDEKIAKETDLSVQAISQLREQFYGKIHQPSELVTIREQMAVMLRTLEANRNEATKAFDASEKAIAALNGKIEALTIANGWKA